MGHTTYNIRKFFFPLAVICFVVLLMSGCNKKETYTVTFDANGGTGTMQQQVFTEGEQQALTKNTFTRDGYIFSGWKGNGANYIDEQNITVTCDITLYAQWTSNGTSPTPEPTPSNTVTITFDANGGSGEMAPQTFVKGVAQLLTDNAFTWENHEFIGWNSAADGTGTPYSNAQEMTLEASVTLYAQWMAASGAFEGHYFVDLGLPSGTKWATCNVGADTPECFGDYFAWGETATKESYVRDTYTYYDEDGLHLTKYTGQDGITILESTDDAATANWGASWRIPTAEEFDELQNNCTVIWTNQNGIDGKLFVGPNGNSIFMPSADCSYAGMGVSGYGYYWSSSLFTSTFNPEAICLRFNSEYCYLHHISRCYGLSVRPVLIENN